MIFSKNSVEQNPNFGGKANHLLAVKDTDVLIPEFVVIPADYLNTFIPSFVENKQEFIANFQFPNQFTHEILSYFDETDFLAVRSSALNEDGKQTSFAGQYETRLFVTKETLNDALISVWSSAFSNRVESYKQQNQITGSGMAIIVQRMINADISGVAFAQNPLTGNKNETVINAVFGLGEGIVSGELNADFFAVENGKIAQQIADKNWAIQFDKENKNGATEVKLNAEKSALPCLNEHQILEVSALVQKMSAHFQAPQDIEFAYQNGKLYLLQTRPITAISAQNQEIVTIWDNSNIVESYPALTLPLTFSFIVKMYEAVYTQLSSIMGIRPKTIAENAPIFKNMLGLLWGRVYYNLNSWHKSLSLLPGYKLNAEFMDNMMGVKEKFDTKIENSNSKLSEYFNVLSAVLKILKTHNSMNKNRIAFQAYFNSVMNEYEAMNFEEMSLQELEQYYHRFENTLVKKWQAPLVNDFFCMIYFGALQKLVINYQLDESGTLHNDLVSGAKDIISTEPITLTLAIVEQIEKSPEVSELFKNNSPEKVWSELQRNEFSEIYHAIKKYIQKWGERCVGELKLETITYKQKPENYIKILQNYVRNQQHKTITEQTNIRQIAEEKVNQKLKGKPVKKMIFSYVLKKARYLVSNRENLRFERTRAFGMVRIMMLELGKKLTAKNVLDTEWDIFYLTQQEIFDFTNGKAVTLDFRTLVQLRKKEYADYETKILPERIKAQGTIYNFEIPNPTAENIENSSILNGIGCCAGIVRGKVSIVHSPTEIENLNNTILVTASTDPGWVVLFPSASAIVVERGSLLSHSAIVSREMGIPCVVGVKNLLNIVKTGDLIEIDGSKGKVKILEKA
ncbi:MAG TPA: PEP/pyruvate-binding domain-containing protein [Crocinitomicaceae bacterium]|nr:PEP/pyruvate-binding domain-containing protein [Crocinitomicaceae bacterium]